MKSNFLSLGWKDILKGLVMAFLSALLTGIYQLFQTSSALNWITIKPVVFVAIGAMLSYLIKNFFTNSQDQLLTKES